MFPFLCNDNDLTNVLQIGLSDTDKAKFPHVFRWADYIQVKNICLFFFLFKFFWELKFVPHEWFVTLVQNKVEFDRLEKIFVQKPQLVFPVSSSVSFLFRDFFGDLARNSPRKSWWM